MTESPQGYVLGPLLLLFYTAELLEISRVPDLSDTRTPTWFYGTVFGVIRQLSLLRAEFQLPKWSFPVGLMVPGGLTSGYGLCPILLVYYVENDFCCSIRALVILVNGKY